MICPGEVFSEYSNMTLHDLECCTIFGIGHKTWEIRESGTSQGDAKSETKTKTKTKTKTHTWEMWEAGRCEGEPWRLWR